MNFLEILAFSAQQEMTKNKHQQQMVLFIIAFSNIMSRKLDKTSRFLTKVLRHEAEKMGINIQEDGYVSVRELLEKTKLSATLEELQEIVRSCKKQRFDLKEISGEYFIRANQGHSIETVKSEKLLQRILLEDLPSNLIAVHGTTLENWKLIKESGGLNRMNRNHIHFATSDDRAQFISGFRTSSQVLIYLNLERALADNIPLYLSSNSVLLSEGLHGLGIIPINYFSMVLDCTTEPPSPLL